MSVFYKGRHRGEFDSAHYGLRAAGYGKACPICVHFFRWTRGRETPPLIRNWTHGMGGNTYDYRMCFPHYEVISAHLMVKVFNGYPRIG